MGGSTVPAWTTRAFTKTFVGKQKQNLCCFLSGGQHDPVAAAAPAGQQAVRVPPRHLVPLLAGGGWGGRGLLAGLLQGPRLHAGGKGGHVLGGGGGHVGVLFYLGGEGETCWGCVLLGGGGYSGGWMCVSVGWGKRVSFGGCVVLMWMAVCLGCRGVFGWEWYEVDWCVCGWMGLYSVGLVWVGGLQYVQWDCCMFGWDAVCSGGVMCVGVGCSEFRWIGMCLGGWACAQMDWCVFGWVVVGYNYWSFSDWAVGCGHCDARLWSWTSQPSRHWVGEDLAGLPHPGRSFCGILGKIFLILHILVGGRYLAPKSQSILK